jgi:hypothetical protein
MHRLLQQQQQQRWQQHVHIRKCRQTAEEQ